MQRRPLRLVTGSAYACPPHTQRGCTQKHGLLQRRVGKGGGDDDEKWLSNCLFSVLFVDVRCVVRVTTRDVF